MKRSLKYLRNCWNTADKYAAILFIPAPAALALLSWALGDSNAILPFVIAAIIGFRWLLDQPEVRLAQIVHGLTGQYATVKLQRDDPENPDQITVHGINKK